MPWLISLIIISPTFAVFVWVLSDTSSKYTWTLARQNIQQLKGVDACGAFNDLEIVSQVEEIAPDVQVFRSVNELNEYAFQDKLVYKPFDKSTVYGIANSLQPTKESSVLDEPVKEEYEVPFGGEFSIWANGSAGNNQSMIVTVLDSSGQEVTRSVLENVGSGNIWKENKFLVDSRGSKFTITSSSNEPQKEGEWILFTRPAVANYLSASDVLPDKKTFSGPFELTRYPCISLPATTFGVWPQIDYVIKDASFWDFNGLSSRSLTEVGCSKYSGACLYKLNYPMAKNIQNTLIPSSP